MEKSKFCPAVWLSGFFALGAVVHFLRAVLGVSLVVAGHAVPVRASVLLTLVFGGLSAAALLLGLKRPCEGSEMKSKGGCCGHSAESH